MHRFLSSTLVTGVLALVLTGCPSQPPAKPVANTPPVQPKTETPAAPAATPAPTSLETNSIQAEKNGFSPGADAPANFLTLDVKFAYAKDIQSWKIAFRSAKDGVQRTLTGKADKLPTTVTWDGKSDAGKLAPEGSYTASLIVDYGAARPADTQGSNPFVLDVTPPSGSVSINPDPYSITGDPAKDALSLQVTTKNGGGQVVSWRLQVIDQDGVVFKSFISEEHRDGNINWDGRADSNGLLKSPSTYNVILKIFDEWGNRGEAQNSLVVGLLAVKDGNRMKIPVDPIIFKAYSPDYNDVGSDLAKRNQAVLDDIANRLKTFGKAVVLLEGHANKVYWQDKAKGDREQKDVLIPLSQDRAEAIKKALVDRGIPADRLKTVGLGADDPVVPFSDYANTWQNRRVVFYLP